MADKEKNEVLTKPSSSRRRAAVVFVAVFLGALLFPRVWCSRGAEQVYAPTTLNEQDLPVLLGREVAVWIQRGISEKDFNTCSSRFDGEWRFGTYQMAALGLLQTVAARPSLEKEFQPVIEMCLDQLNTASVRTFDTEAWREDAIASLDGTEAHAAYLGYYNLALSFYRQVITQPAPRFVALNDEITAALVRHLRASKTLLLETYPGETYPVDNCAVIGGVAIHGRLTDNKETMLLVNDWVATCRAKYVDKASGMLIQAVDADNGSALDKPRASGTALGVYFLAFADKAFSKELYESMRKNCATIAVGFATVSEYPPTVEAESGDIDSGPVILGQSFSGTGFCVAGSRIHEDREMFVALYSTVQLFGAPLLREGRLYYATGGPLGNAIMLAMFTAGDGLQ